MAQSCFNFAFLSSQSHSSCFLSLRLISHCWIEFRNRRQLKLIVHLLLWSKLILVFLFVWRLHVQILLNHFVLLWNFLLLLILSFLIKIFSHVICNSHQSLRCAYLITLIRNWAWNNLLNLLIILFVILL